MCVGCRNVRPASELVRFGQRPDGRLAVGPGPGRGAWLCGDRPECLETAERRRAIDRALRTPIPAPAMALLRATLAQRASMEAWLPRD